MQKHDTIFVAGASGMVGSAIIRALQAKGYTNIIGSYHSRKPDPSLITDYSSLITYQLDLTNQAAVHSFFAQHQPSYVVLAAAKVGGIMANNTYRADFIYQNLMMEANVIHAAYAYEAKKLLFLGSSCIYPKLAGQPMGEEALLTGPLEPTNEPYALAKIAGIRMCDAYNRQYGTNFISVMPTNLYGPGDNFDLETSHVLPALIRKFHLGKCLEQGDWDALRADLNARPVSGADGTVSEEAILCALASHGITFSPDASRFTPHDSRSTHLTPYESSPLVTISLWGTGSPLREFLHVDDLASACAFLLENIDYKDIVFTDESGTVHSHINVGSGDELSLRELAQVIREVIGFQGLIDWDSRKPDGTPRKLIDSRKLNQFGYQANITFDYGVMKFYDMYRA